MYRGGLIWNIVAQTMMAIVWFILAILADSIFGTVKDTDKSFSGVQLGTISSTSTGLVAAFVIFGIINIIGIILCSLALKNLAAAESGKESFRSGFGTAAGVIGLFTNFIGGILVLVGITSEKERLNGSSHNSFDNRRDDYRQRRSDDFDRGRRDDRRDSYRRDDRRDSYRRDDERDDYGRGR